MPTTSTARCARDGRAAYGPHEVDDDAFPGSRVLEDLRHAADQDVPRILARYAALRSWLLRDGDRVLAGHAVQTARVYLAAVGDWPGAEALERLAVGDLDLDAVWRAGSEAAAAGHRESAFALWRTGYTAARRRGDLARAGRLAAGISALLRRERLDGAALWARRAQRLRRLDGS